MFSAKHPATELDLFLESPFDFDDAFGRARRLEVAAGLEATLEPLTDLLEMKRKAGRPQDLLDVEGLESLGAQSEGGDA